MPDVAAAPHISDADPFTVEAVCDPQTHDGALRELAPAVYLERYDIWAVGRHEHVYAAARDWVIDASTFDVWVGGDSTADGATAFEVTET